MFFEIGPKVKFPVKFKYLGIPGYPNSPLVMTEIKTAAQEEFGGCLILKPGEEFILSEKQYRMLFCGEQPLYPPKHFKFVKSVFSEPPVLKEDEPKKAK